MIRVLAVLLIVSTCTAAAGGADLPPGVVNTQNRKDIPLSPEESLKRITVPDGFRVTLFAGEPDLRRPIAFDFDDRGRLWVVENYSHPVWNPDGACDRIRLARADTRRGWRSLANGPFQHPQRLTRPENSSCGP